MARKNINTDYRFSSEGELVALNAEVDGEVVEEIVVGTYELKPVLVRVGGGKTVHSGSTFEVTFDTAHAFLNRGFVSCFVKEGEVRRFEPYQSCGTSSTYAGGMRGRNSIIKEGEVSCTRCLKLAGK